MTMSNQIKRRYAYYQTGDVLQGSEVGDNGPIATAEDDAGKDEERDEEEGRMKTVFS